MPPGDGEILSSTCPAQGRLGQPLVLVGAFRIRRAGLTAFGVAPHRALTLIIVPGVHAQAAQATLPFADAALFDDDLITHRDTVVGYYQFDLGGSPACSFAGGIHVSVQLGRLLAPVLRIELV